MKTTSVFRSAMFRFLAAVLLFVGLLGCAIETVNATWFTLSVGVMAFSVVAGMVSLVLHTKN